VIVRACSVLALVVLSACGRPSIPDDPKATCRSRDCKAVRSLAARELRCAREDVLVRDEGTKRLRAIGCGRTARFDCERGCALVGEVDEIGLEREAAYRAAFVLRCDPRDVEVAGEAPSFVASCRAVEIQLRCDATHGCRFASDGVDFDHVMRRIEPDALRCARRREAEMLVRADGNGEIVEVSMEGMRTVRPRRDATRADATAGRIECLANLFKRLPRLPDVAGEARAVRFGGPRYRAPDRVLYAAPADGQDGADTETDATTPVSDEGGEAWLRARLDAERDAILACAQVDEVLVVAQWSDEGDVSLALAGGLAGSPSEGCVRAALGPLRVSADAPGELHHLVRHAQPAPH
jgi:hypothetical protein